MKGRFIGCFLLLTGAAVSVGLACVGAERALMAMRHPLGMVALLTFAVAMLIPVVRHPLRWSSTLHLGLALVLIGWLWNEVAGVPGGYLDLRAGQTGAVADAFNLTVRNFQIERYAKTGAVCQYRCAAEIEVLGEPVEAVEISVNHPLIKRGWWVYQSSYRPMENPHTGEPVYFTILECVRDIGLPIVGLGAVFLLLGAAGYMRWHWSVIPTSIRRSLTSSPMRRVARILYLLAFLVAVVMLVIRGFVTGHPPMQNMYEFLMCTLVLLPILTFISAKVDQCDTLLTDAILMAVVAIPVLFFMDSSVKQLMPALQSPFFIPHVGAYVMGYVLLVRVALGAGRRLLGVGFFLLTLGLVLGAVWGKVCWGHWWQFDPKEMWSLATWFVYLAYFHVQGKLSKRAHMVYLVMGAVMIVLTLTWINLSRLFTGMHSYA